MGRIGRSFQLVGQSYRILMQDKELMVLPLISGAIIVAVAASFFFGFGVTGDRIEEKDATLYLPMVLLYIAVYAIGIFFQAAVVAGATERMRGGDPTVGSALSAAFSRIGPIMLWAVVAGTVGYILKAIQQQGFIGKLLGGFLGLAWSLATFFVVPVLVLEQKSVRESFTRSSGVFRKTWGEAFVGSASLGIAGVCAWLTLVAVVGLLAFIGAGVVVSIAVFAAGAIFLMAFFSSLQGIYVASLYRYATEGQVTSGFNQAVLAEAFVPKRR